MASDIVKGLMLVALLGPGGCGGPAADHPRAVASGAEPFDVARRPARHFAGLTSDALEETLFIPIGDALSLRDPGESANVDRQDELADSSWFQNRLGRRALSRQELLAGPCTEGLLEKEEGPWEVVSAKEEGRTPGVFIRTRSGRRYLLKMEERFRPERSSAADAIASRIHHAVGYNAPCNEVVHFPASRLTVGAKATRLDRLGRKNPLRERHLSRLLQKVYRLPDGQVRASASHILPGEPIGPFAWEGLRRDDPNDRTPHEDRRELRAYRVLSAWLGHFDVRGENSLDTWVKEGDRHVVRHYQLDFGDCFGSPFLDERKSRRMNHAYFFDAGQILADVLTLGLIPRPWHRSKVTPGLDVFAYFNVEDFRPADWKPIQPNRAFSRMTLRDAQWMARILARFSDGEIHALSRLGRFSKPEVALALARVLIGRRDRIVAEYLTGHVPLGRPWISTTGAARASDPAAGRGRHWLCVEDLAVRGGVMPAGQVRYRRRLLTPPGRRGERPTVRQENWYGLAGQRAVGCVPLPVLAAGGAEVMELAVMQGHRRAGAMTVVLREVDGAPVVVAVQRRERPMEVQKTR